ncbi:hypothetical protein Q9L58_009692 [Maublancomyces gigas]|uniref:Uncharacterized protein n=1 Tax=Discina gigas TaxID=1032678 RepID=A0ABR3G668_9PEZI
MGCDIVMAKKLINAMVDIDGASSSDGMSPSDVLDVRFSCLDHSKDNTNLASLGDFITGVSLRAATKPKFLALFISIPYLGVGADISASGSRTLKQYRLRTPFKPAPPPTSPGGPAPPTSPGGPAPPPTSPGGPAPPPTSPGVPASPTSSRVQILVHQTWFLCFDNEKIAIFRSKDDKYNNRAPLFLYQQRVGAFQGLMHMISNIITLSEQEALENLRQKITEWELSRESGSPVPITQLGSYQTDLYTMIQVVLSQTKYLEDLRQIFQTSYHSDFNDRPQWNKFKIPYIGDHKEQIRCTIKSITAIVADREKLLKDLRELGKDLKLLRVLVVPPTRVYLENGQF